MKYLLDTDICVYITRRKPTQVQARFEQLRPADLAMSVVTYLELIFGAYKSRRREANLAVISQLGDLIAIQPLDANVANHYGRVRLELEKRGSAIGAYDLLIAAHALSLGLILVTNNTREFARVAGLRLENWVA